MNKALYMYVCFVENRITSHFNMQFNCFYKGTEMYVMKNTFFPSSAYYECKMSKLNICATINGSSHRI